MRDERLKVKGYEAMGARGADVFAGAKGMCLRQDASRSEVESGLVALGRTSEANETSEASEAMR